MAPLSVCLWFDNNADEAVAFYTAIFPQSRRGAASSNTDDAPGPTGETLASTFELDGTHFTVINGGPMYTFTPAISLVVNCATQDEVDYFWSRLSEGGEEGRCGWLTDRFGVSWQVVPTRLGELMSSSDAAVANRTMRAMLTMSKLDIAALEKAASEDESAGDVAVQ